MELDRAIDITTDQRKTLLALLERHLPNTTAWVYGSHVKWTTRPQSDLDLVVFATPEQEHHVSELREAFEESNLPFRVDLFVWDAVPEQFRKQIEAEHVVLVGEKESRMVGKRRYIPASEFCASVRDGTHDSPKPVERGRKLVTSRHLTTGQLDISDAYLISEEYFERINKRSKVDKWDVLISMIGTVGESCLIKEEPDFAIKNIGLFKTRSEADGKWLYYYLRTKTAQKSIREQSRGTTQQYIPLKALRNFPILVADDPEEQRVIAHILGTLDDKIELNRRMNETLEAMARALFKSWFIDFDPVRAKMAGRDPSLPQHLADLFSDRLVDSELGLIPEGWEVSTIGQEVDVVGGSTPSTKDPSFWHGTINWATPKDLSSLKSPVLVETSRKITEKGLYKIGSGLLPRGTVLLSSRAPIGYLVISDVPVAINQGFIAMKCQKRLSATYVWLWAAASMAAILENANGSTFQEISKSNFRPLPVIVPNVSIRKIHDTLMQMLYDRVVKNERQSRTLAVLRDTLLPKLVSGSIRVNNAEFAFEGVE